MYTRNVGPFLCELSVVCKFMKTGLLGCKTFFMLN